MWIFWVPQGRQELIGYTVKETIVPHLLCNYRRYNSHYSMFTANRNSYLEGCPVRACIRHFNLPVMFIDNTVADGQAQACAFSHLLDGSLIAISSNCRIKSGMTE